MGQMWSISKNSSSFEQFVIHGRKRNYTELYEAVRPHCWPIDHLQIHSTTKGMPYYDHESSEWYNENIRYYCFFFFLRWLEGKYIIYVCLSLQIMIIEFFKIEKKSVRYNLNKIKTWIKIAKKIQSMKHKKWWW